MYCLLLILKMSYLSPLLSSYFDQCGFTVFSSYLWINNRQNVFHFFLQCRMNDLVTLLIYKILLIAMKPLRRSVISPNGRMHNLRSLILGIRPFVMLAIALTRTETHLHLQTITVTNNENNGLFDVFNTYDGSYVFQWENERTYRLTSY